MVNNNIMKSLINNQIDSIISVLKLRRSKNKSNRETINNIISQLEDSKKLLSESKELGESDISSILRVIALEETDSCTTASALRSLYMLISYDIICINSSNLIALVVDTVNDTKFTSLGVESDEIVLFEIIQLFQLLNYKHLLVNLSDTQFCSCLQTCFCIYFDHRFSQVLRRSSEFFLINCLLYLFNTKSGENEQTLHILKKLTNQPIIMKKRNIYCLSDNSNHISTDENNETEIISQNIINPIGISTTHELLRFLISLSDSTNKYTSKEFIEFSLSLLSIAFEAGLGRICETPILIDLVKRQLCKHICELFQHESLSIFTKSLHIFTMILRFALQYLKNESEILLFTLLNMYNANNERVSSEKRTVIREFLLETFNNFQFLIEIYINYDIQINSYNLFEMYFQFLTRLITDEGHLNGLEILVKFIIYLDSTPFDPQLEISYIMEYKRKKYYNCGVKILNTNFSKGIEYFQNKHVIGPEYESTIAAMFKYDMSIDRKTVGDTIGNRKYPKLLEQYIKMFNFHNTRIDVALRQFLGNFRIPGESQVISNILEKFCHQYLAHNLNSFKSFDIIFTLSYAIIMLNVDQHNTNVKQQKSMALEDFVNNLRGVNDKQDFPLQLVKSIYDSIHDEEIVVPIERSGAILNNYIWQMIVERNEFEPPKYHKIERIIMQRNIFRVIVHSTITSLCRLMQRNLSSNILQLTIDAYYIITKLAAKFQYNQTVDKLVVQLLKYSRLLRANIDPSPLDIDTILNDLAYNTISQACLVQSFRIVFNFGNCLTLSWRYILCCISNLCACELLPIELYECEDFVNSDGRYFLKVGKRLDRQKSSVSAPSLINSFVQLIITNTEDDDQHDVEDPYKIAQNIVIDCKITEIFNNFKNLSNQSFIELSKSLIKFAHYSPPKFSYDVESSESVYACFLISPSVTTFFLQLLLTFSLTNKHRIELILPEIIDLFHHLTTKSTTFTILTLRAVDGVIRLASRLMDVSPAIYTQVMLPIRLLLINPAIVTRYSVTAIYGLYELIRSRYTFINSCWDWVCIFEIIEIAGVGRSHIVTSVNVYPEIIEHGSCSTSSFLQDTHLSEIYQQKALYDAIDDSTKDDVFQFKSSFNDFDLLSFIKSIQCLSFVIKNQPQHLTYSNVLPTVHALCTVAERIFYLALAFPLNQHKHMRNEIDDQQLELYTNAVLDLLLNMFSVSSCRFFAHFHSMNKESLSSLERGSFVWYSCWYHLLKRISVFIVDFRRHIRLSCLQTIERALRISDIQHLGVSEWFLCFDSVLLPMSYLLLTHPPSVDSAELDETKVRTIALVMRLFLQNINDLPQHALFPSLWSRVLELLFQYLNSNTCDMIQEALPEYLKNMLSVMNTTGLLDSSNPSPTSLWNITTQHVARHLPNFQLSFITDIHQIPSSPTVTPSIPNNVYNFTMPNFKIVSAPRVDHTPQG